MKVAFVSLVCSLYAVSARKLKGDKGTKPQAVGDPNYLQLSSTIDQPNGPIGAGVGITYNSEDALNGMAFEGSEVEILEDAHYFFVAAPQVAGPGDSDYIADYYLGINGEDVANSGVRLSGNEFHQDVILIAGVIPFVAGDKFKVLGSGSGAITKVIDEPGEPLVPSIIFSMFELQFPTFIQLSSTLTQPNGPFGSGVAITYNSIDGQLGVGFDLGSSEIQILEDGAYMVIIAPQVGGRGEKNKAFADYWVKVNGMDAANSNVRYVSADEFSDVIICQGVYELGAGDSIEVFGSGLNSENVFLSPDGEPAIPSIIVTAYKLNPGAAYTQLSSTETQVNGPLGEGVPITFNSIDAINGVDFHDDHPDEILIMEDGAYFIVAAPQIGAVDFLAGSQIADYWIRVNGVNVGNSNVRYEDNSKYEDVIVCQGVYELMAGDIVQVIGSGDNSKTTAIEEPGEPLVPSIIFSMHMI